jgi:hypothetical protein
MSNTRETLPTLDLAALEDVSGGRRRSTSSSGSSVDMQLLDSLNDIETALNNLANKSSSGNDNMMNTMLMMSLLNQPQPQQPQAPTVICNRKGRCW